MVTIRNTERPDAHRRRRAHARRLRLPADLSDGAPAQAAARPPEERGPAVPRAEPVTQNALPGSERIRHQRRDRVY